MIVLTRLNGATVAVNPDLITVIDVTPDTTLSLLNGDRLIVRQTLDELIAKVVEFRQTVGRTTNPVDVIAAARGENVGTATAPHHLNPKREG